MATQNENSEFKRGAQAVLQYLHDAELLDAGEFESAQAQAHFGVTVKVAEHTPDEDRSEDV